MAVIDTVVFDLGGVLVDWNPAYLYRKIFSSEEEMNWFLDNITTSDWNEAQDGGRSLQEATELLLSQYPEHESNIRAYYDRWEEMLGGPIHETVEILQELKQIPGFLTYALTNWSGETFPIALQRFEFLHWFDGRLVSGDEKTRKPFPEIYQLLIDRFHINPHTAVYTDDNVRNLHPARDFGFTTLQFRNPAEFRADLVRLGVLAPIS